MFPVAIFRRFLLDKMVLRPTRHVIDHGDQRRLTLNTQTGTIEYFCHAVGPDRAVPDLVVLKFPGTAGRAERSSPFPLDTVSENAMAIGNGPIAGQVFTWNPPGYGRSEGKAKLSSMVHAANDFFSAVVPMLPESTTVWLLGNSLGCNTAFYLAATGEHADRVDGLVLRNPPPLIPVVKNVASQYPMGKYLDRVAESLIDDMNAEQTVPRIQAPAVFLQSQLDTLVHPEVQDRLIEMFQPPKRVVRLEGLDHGGIPTQSHDQQIAGQIAWLWNQSRRTERDSE